MDIQIVLGLSIVFALGAATLALWLIHITGRHLAWALIAAGMALMAARHAVVLAHFTYGDNTHGPDISGELIALVTSAIMVIGFAVLVPMFLSSRRSENALRDSEERFRSFFDDLGNAVYRADAQGNITYANKFSEKLTGLPLEDILGKPFAPLFTSESQRVAADVFQRTLDGQSPEYELTFTSGKTCRFKNRPLRDDDGRIVGVFGISRDISERKQAEKHLRLLSAAVDQTSEGIAVTDLGGNLQYANHAFATMHGYPHEELVGKHLSTFHSPEQMQAMEVSITQVKQRGVFHGEIQHIRDDGTSFTTSMHNSLLTDEAGNPVGMIATLRDITERKRDEQELLETKQRLQHLLTSSPSVIFSCGLGPDYPTTFIGENVVKQLGYEPRAFYEDTFFWTKRIHPEDADRVLGEFSRAERGDHVSYEYRLRHNKGHYVWIHNEVAPLRNKDGSIYGVVGSWFDITDCKRVEEALRKTRDDLERRVEERTAALTDANERLRREITERERAEEALRESEEKFRSLVEATSDWVWEVDRDGRYTYASPKVRDLLGYEPEEVIGKTPFDFMPPDEAQRTAGLFGDRVELREPFSGLENINLHRDGREVVLESSGVPILDADGDLLGYRGIDRDITKRKRAEEDLRESRSRYHTLLETLPQNIFHKDRNSVYVTGNENFARALGLTPDGLAGKTDYDFFPKELADKYRADDRRVMESGATVEVDEEYIEDGEPRIVHTVKTPVRDEAGTSTGVLGIYWDITERKRVDEALRESEEHLRTVIGASKDAMIAVGENGMVTLFNPAAERMFDHPAREMLGQPLDCLMPEEYRERHRGYIEGYFRRGEPGEAIGKTLELPAIRSDGHRFPIELSLSTGHRGGQRFALAVIRDITERVRAKEALVTRLRYEEGLAACSEAILVDTDTEEALTDSLHHLLRASNVSRVYIFENFQDPTDGLCMRQRYEACATGVGPEIGNPLLQRLPYKHGFARWREKLPRGEPVGGVVKDFAESERKVLEPQDILSILVLPIFSGGDWYGFIGFDDTRMPRTWTEEDVRLLQTAAEMIGAFIARGRAEAKLRQAKEAAEAASRAKSVFLANMSHEIRTPITAVLASAEFLAAQDSNRPHEFDHLDVIFRNGRHLLALIDDLLDLSRTEAGKLEVRRESCHIPDIIADVRATTELLHQREGVDFRILYETAIPTQIHTDPTRLKQAVINLISNALKFTEKGHVRVRVAVRRDGPEPRLSIAVEDTGVGVPADKIDRIFQTFAQIEPGPSGIFGGVGLGLPLAKWIAEQLGGTVEVDSVEDHGSTFTLRIAIGPLDGAEWIRPDDILIAPRLRIPVRVKRGEHRLRGHVLLAEDFSDTRKLIEEILTECGVTVTTVDNGEDAVEAALAQAFDVILMDIRMPRMDGLAATIELRRRGCLTPIIALTALTTGSDRERILDSGFDDIWKKPITLDRLVEDVTAYLHAPPDETASVDRAESARSLVTTENPRLAAVREEFVRNLPSRLDRIRAAISSGDMRGAREALHQLVGAGGTHGFMPISHEAARLLDLAKAGALAERLDELHTLDKLVAQALTTVREQGGTGPQTPSRPASSTGPV